MFVKLTDDPSRAKVRDPATNRFLGTEMLEVPDRDKYWRRLIAHGDVLKVEPKPESKPEPQAELQLSSTAPVENAP